MYIRFVVAGDTDNLWRSDGVIQATLELFKQEKLEVYEMEVVKSAIEWFNENLLGPPFDENHKSGAWTHNTLSWFFDHAKEPISRMWDLVAVLREHGIEVRIFRAEHIGDIVYRDAFQVVAESPTTDFREWLLAWVKRNPPD